MIVHMGQRTTLLLALLLPWLVAGAPATTQSQPVEIKTTKIEMSPTLVSLKLNKVSAAEMFNKLSQEANVRLAAQDDGLWDDPSLQQASFSTEWDKQPMWSALREACEAAGNVRIQPDDSNEGNGRVQLLKGTMPPSLSVDGPVMIWPRHLIRSAQVSYADGTHKPDEVRLMLMVLPEPKLRQFAWFGGPKLDKAEDDRGHSLVPGAAVSTRGSANGTDLPIVLDYPANVGSKIAFIRGSVEMEVPAELATISFKPPFEKLENLKADVGPNRLVLNKVRKEENSAYHIDFSLLRGEKETDEHWSAIAEPFGRFAAPVTMVGIRGQTRQNGGSTGPTEKGLGLHADLYFPPREPGDEATELRVVLPVKFTTLAAKFEFKDLPMP
jgi:hypothetical protein